MQYVRAMTHIYYYIRYTYMQATAHLPYARINHDYLPPYRKRMFSVHNIMAFPMRFLCLR